MTKRAWAAIGLFDSPDALLKAAAKLRGSKLGRVQAYTPYPVHHLDEALGLRRSPLGGMVFVMGILGALTALGFQYWISAIDYPIVTGGKAPDSWQAFVPIMFEVMVLFATLTAGLGMLLLLNRLPDIFHPMLGAKAMAKITRDRLALTVESSGKDGIDADAAKKALLDLGAQDVEILPFPAQEPAAPLNLLFGLGGAILAVCVIAGISTYWVIKLYPELPPMSHMERQPRQNSQGASSFFKDGRGMRPMPVGSVARGHLPYLIKTPEEAARLVNPLPRTQATMEKGRALYTVYCRVCHGSLGNGMPTMTSAYGAKPADLRIKRLAQMPDGGIYHTIMVGKNAMPSYAYELKEDERWAVIHYLRALQRAQDARAADLP
jgi:mono/diheme cytochrome c family protein